MPDDELPQGDSRVDVAPRDRPDGVDEEKQRQTECEGDTQIADFRAGEHCGADCGEYEHEGSDCFGYTFLEVGEVVGTELLEVRFTFWSHAASVMRTEVTRERTATAL